jgi:elongation factor P
MDPESFEQKPLGKDIVEAALPYLKENTIVKFKTLEGRVIGVDLPDHIDLLVEDTEPGVRGDTVSGATKPATMETGVVVQVPLFIEPGEVIKVDTRSGDYLGRVGK